MRPWNEVNAALQTLWFQYWIQRFQHPHGKNRYKESVELLTREIVLRDQRIRELEDMILELNRKIKEDPWQPRATLLDMLKKALKNP